MSYELSWEIEGRVAINTLYGEVTAADVHDLRHAARDLSNTLPGIFPKSQAGPSIRWLI